MTDLTEGHLSATLEDQAAIADVKSSTMTLAAYWQPFDRTMTGASNHSEHQTSHFQARK